MDNNPRSLVGVSEDRISAEAAAVRFFPFVGVALRNTLLFAFGSVGWLLGSLWFALVYARYAVYYGYLKGAHKPAPQPKQPSIPQ